MTADLPSPPEDVMHRRHRYGLARAALVVVIAVAAAVVLGRGVLAPRQDPAAATVRQEAASPSTGSAGPSSPSGGPSTSSPSSSPSGDPTGTATETPSPSPDPGTLPSESPTSPSRTGEATLPPVAPLAQRPSERQIREWIREDRLPEAPSHGYVFATMADDLWRDGAPDVMFFGDSMVQQGIEPSVLASLVHQGTGRTVRVFNGGSSRARWGVNLMLARYAARHHVLPKVAVLGITTLAVNDDDFYADEVATTPFSAVSEGCDRRDWGASSRARCERYRTDLRYRFAAEPQMLARAAAGDLLPQVLRVDKHSILRRDGSLSHASMTIREVERNSAQRLQRRTPGRPLVQPGSRAQFDELVALLRSHGVAVLAFSLPYSPAHQRTLDAAFPGYEQQRRAGAAELAASAGVPLVQVPSYGAWWGDGDSRDAIHLTRPGARSFTRQLWDDRTFRAQLLAGLGAPAASSR